MERTENRTMQSTHALHRNSNICLKNTKPKKNHFEKERKRKKEIRKVFFVKKRKRKKENRILFENQKKH